MTNEGASVAAPPPAASLRSSPATFACTTIYVTALRRKKHALSLCSDCLTKLKRPIDSNCPSKIEVAKNINKL